MKKILLLRKCLMAATLLAGAMLLAGCEKEQPQIEETHNLLKKRL